MTTEDTKLDNGTSLEGPSSDAYCETREHTFLGSVTDATLPESGDELSAEGLEERPDEKSAEAAPSLPLELRAPLIQALLISFGEPLAIDQLTETTQLTPDEIRVALDELRDLLALPSSGIELVEVNARFQIRTKVAFSPYIRTLKAERPRRLSSPALETLAIVAYQQPVAKSDIDKLRGVDSTPTLKTLLERGLVRVVGQAASVGHPSLYGTTDDFLKIFGLSALTDLPSLREAGSLERDPGEPDEAPRDDDLDGRPLEEMNDTSVAEHEGSTEEDPSPSPLRGLVSRITIERISDEEATEAGESEPSWFNVNHGTSTSHQLDEVPTEEATSPSEPSESASAEEDQDRDP